MSTFALRFNKNCEMTIEEAIELLKQREQSQASLNSAESQQKSTEGQLVKQRQ